MGVLNSRGNRILWLIALLTALSHVSVAQQSHLSKRITFSCENMRLDDALEAISTAAQFSFSYNAGLIRGDRLVTIGVTEERMSQVLRNLLGEEIHGKEAGNHVILVRMPNREEKQEMKARTGYLISGYVLDARTGHRLKDATIYEVSNRKTDLSDDKGQYRFMLSAFSGRQGLYFSKAGYFDTVVFLQPVRDLTLDVSLMPLYGDIPRLTALPAGFTRVNPIDSLPFLTALVPHKVRVTSENLQVGRTRAFQVSLIPFVGTNWMSKGAYTSAVSFNLLAGYSGGVNGFELGGLLNMSRNNVRGLQIGGFGNITGRRMEGVQIGGLFNVDLGPAKGLQIGGLMNYQGDTLTGVQIGGLCNYLDGKMQGVQVGGLANIATGHADGWQVAGLVNVARYDVSQLQLAGFTNYGRHIYGIQIGGLASIASGNVNGMQVSGFFNYARSVNGVQVGAINVSKYLEAGVPIGFYSYVHRGGMHAFAVYGDEVFYLNIAHRSGTRKFYNVFQLGLGNSWMVNYMYGIGTSFRLGDRLDLTLEIISGLVFSTTPGLTLHGCLTKLLPAVEYRLGKRLALFGGPTYNLYAFDTGRTVMTSGIAPYTFFNQVKGRQRLQMWIGGTVGIRF